MPHRFDRRAGDDHRDFCEKLKANPVDWCDFMAAISDSTGDATSTSLPDPLQWREYVENLGSLTGLRRKDFGEDESGYVKAIATMVSPPRRPENMPLLPDHFVKPAIVDDVISKFLETITERNAHHVVLTGMGGAGKSLIASAVIRDKLLLRHFEHGVLWLNDEARDYDEPNFLLNLNNLAAQFQDLVLSRFYRQGRASQYQPVNFTTVQDAQKYFLMWKNKQTLKCLLVVDSAWNLVRPLLL